jgi:hypothetical protein
MSWRRIIERQTDAKTPLLIKIPVVIQMFYLVSGLW